MLRRSIHLLYWFGPFLWDVFHVFFIYKMCLINDRGCYKKAIILEKAPKREFEICKWFFFFFCFGKSLCWEKLCPQVWIVAATPTFFRDLGWFSSVTIWDYEQNKSFAFKLGLSVHCLVRSLVVITGTDTNSKRLGFQIWSCWPWLLLFLPSEGNSFLKNKITIPSLTEKIFTYEKDHLFEDQLW